MQALELLPSTLGSTDGVEPSPAKNFRDPSAPDGEFGRLMERAMSPSDKDQGDTDTATRKGKAPTTSGKVHAGKKQATHIDSSTGANVKTAKTEDEQKPDTTLNLLTKEPATTSKEKAQTDLTPAVPVRVEDVIQPLPVLLPLQMMGQHVTDEADVEMPAVAVPAPVVAQPISAIGTVNPLSTIASNPVITADGKNSAAILPEEKRQSKKMDGESISSLEVPADLTGKVSIADNTPAPASSTAEPQVLQPESKAKVTLPPTNSDKSAPEPVKAQNTDSNDHKLAESKPKTDVSVQPDDKLEVMASNALEPAKNDGIGVAITPLSMKKTENANKVAGLDVQVLPVGTNDAARETVLPAHATVIPIRMAEKSTSDLSPTMPGTNPVVADTQETAGAIALPSLTDARMRDVERTHDMVSLHALRMVSSTSDSMQVVIKPGAGTELSLELRHRNGGLEAEATLQRGDYQLMNQHWPELQQKLEQRGIKLAPLGGGEANFTTADNGNFSRQQQSARDEAAAQQASAFAEFTVAMNRGGATARLAPVSAGGWESWA